MYIRYQISVTVQDFLPTMFLNDNAVTEYTYAFLLLTELKMNIPL